MNRISMRCLALLAATAAIAVGARTRAVRQHFRRLRRSDEAAAASGRCAERAPLAGADPGSLTATCDLLASRPAGRRSDPRRPAGAQSGQWRRNPVPAAAAAPRRSFGAAAPSQPDSSTARSSRLPLRRSRHCRACRTANASRAGRRRIRSQILPRRQKTKRRRRAARLSKSPTRRAVFSGLDKITGRITSFDVAIGETVQFGALQVTPRACYTRKANETGNTDGFIEVDEVTLEGEVKRIFTGWMFASSPGLHAVEHPIYDVWLTDCQKAPQSVAETKADDNADDKANDASPPPPVRRNPPRGRRSSTTR